MPNSSPPVVLVYPDRAALAWGAAAMFTQIAMAAVDARGRAAMALAGGTTPRETYDVLAQSPWRERVPWFALDVWFGDERMVPADDPRSNVRMAREALLNHVPIEPSRVHAPRVTGDVAECAAEYAARLTAAVASSESGWPRLDLVLLGLGADGHTASLFPGKASLHANARWVVADHVHAVPMWRVTLTAMVINAAAEVVFVVSGDAKAAIVRKVLESPDQQHKLPAQLIVPTDGRVHWLLDAPAAADLSNV